MTDKERLSSEIVVYLNELLEADEKAITELFNIEIKCNNLLENHPYLLVKNKNNNTYITVLGIINGLLGLRKIAKKESQGRIISFCKKKYTGE